MKTNVEKKCRKELELMNLRGVGAYLGVSKRTARRLIDQRAIKFYRVSRSIRVDKHDLNEYLKTRMVDNKMY